uniref:Oxidation resistance protein 1 n=1 Tax=Amphora coffeiformis TaxID=265554 RepID=A0A7S3P0I1_9STRA|mmetsp:Transcript_13823/g.26536  ORF Transcript_13823/g.26536 Transcript_13823/m.26536 type:complete len:508 (-) Transcript_13823:53-1576(-)|eukprot:scaffold2413_cov171-Amphora_coffeaeformis.AAC.13
MKDTDKSPECERMKSRNESFDNDSITDKNGKNHPLESPAQQPGLLNDDESDDDDAFVSNDENNGELEEDCLHFLDATQFLNNQYSRAPNNNDNNQHELPQQRSSGSATRDYQRSDTDEFQDAVASSGALVGENIFDSPSQYQRSVVSARGLAPPALPCFRDGTRAQSNYNSDDEVDPGVSVGLVAQGLAWVKSQRESRRRRYLQFQAEEQLRKIREAQNAERQNAAVNNNKGLFSNSIFQNLASTVTGGQGDAGDNHEGLRRRQDSVEADDCADTEDISGPQATVSQSGAGYSVELAVSDNEEEEEEDASWIPPVRLEEEESSEEGLAPCLLNAGQRQQVAQHVLPTGIAYAKWKRVYSLARDGDSFDSCLRLVKDYNQTLMIIRTSKNEIFGGFADAAWEQPHLVGAQFYGGPGSCLFKVPDPTLSKIKAYGWTGANRYIQLTDTHRKLMAFGGGGKEGSFGLCVESDFQRGSTGHCETFGNDPLCNEENFTIVDVEIFGFLLGQF